MNADDLLIRRLSSDVQIGVLVAVDFWSGVISTIQSCEGYQDRVIQPNSICFLLVKFLLSVNRKSKVRVLIQFMSLISQY